MDPHGGPIIESPPDSPEEDSPQDDPGTGSTKTPETPSGDLEDTSHVLSSGGHEDATPVVSTEIVCTQGYV